MAIVSLEYCVKNQKPIVFIHIPRTGGTSLHEMLTNKITGQRPCPARFYFDLRLYSREELQKYNLFSGHFGVEDCHLIDQPRYITLLRDPVDRVISLYTLWNAQVGIYRGTPRTDQNYAGVQLAINTTIDDFVRTTNPKILSKISNTQSRFILSGIGKDSFNENLGENTVEKVIERLENEFAWYGTIEQLSANDKDLWKRLDVKTIDDSLPPHLNQITDLNKIDVSEETIDYIMSINQFDRALHQYVAHDERQEASSTFRRLINLPMQQISSIRGLT